MSIKHIRTKLFRATQIEFAAALGVDQAAISRWETGFAYPDLKQLTKIRKVARKRFPRQWKDSLFWVER